MRDNSEGTTATLEAPGTETLSFNVTDVTGSRETSFEVDPRTPVRAVTQAIAARFALPANSTWQLRSDRTSAFLDDDRPVSGQIGPQERVTITPKAHLG
jgi:hypothetical protein